MCQSLTSLASFAEEEILYRKKGSERQGMDRKHGGGVGEDPYSLSIALLPSTARQKKSLPSGCDTRQKDLGCSENAF